MTTSLVLYFQSDGSAAIFDPARNPTCDESGVQPPVVEVHAGDSYSLHNATLDELDAESEPPPAYRFREQREILHGLGQGDRLQCNGLIADWVLWQYKKDPAFDSLQQVLHKLAEGLGEEIAVADPVRLAPTDPRDYPALRIGKEIVPLPYASAGIIRVATMAYLLVWVWHEHKAACQLQGRSTAKELVLLWDEVEAHLHPRWQRTILPSFRAAFDGLTNSGIDLQLLLATHSPLVAASLEVELDSSKDSIFRFEFVSGQPSIEKQEVEKRGTADVWLEDLFHLQEPGSVEREKAVQDAKLAMDSGVRDPTRLERISTELAQSLPDFDPFYVDWKLYLRSNS
jgi:hypothetical protein